MKFPLLIPLGGGNEVGASCYLYDFGKTRILVDCGIRFDKTSPLPSFEILKSFDIDAVILTHAHVDHCGAVHLLTETFKNVPIISTVETALLSSLMIEDGIKVRAIRGIADESLELKLLDKALLNWQKVSFFETFKVKDVEITLLPAGHVLGAASVLFSWGGKKVFHTGDISFKTMQTVSSAVLPEGADTIVSEGTYLFSKLKNFDEEEFLSQISSIVEGGGKVLLPAFALGRAQELMMILGRAMRQGRLLPLKVGVDGMASRIAEVYQALTLKNLFNAMILPARGSVEENLSEFDCIISTSGMLLEGTPSFSYAQAIKNDDKSAVVFCGYLAEESFGYRLISDRKVLKDFKAKILKHRLSAHATGEELKALKDKLSAEKQLYVHCPLPKHTKDFAFNLELVEL